MPSSWQTLRGSRGAPLRAAALAAAAPAGSSRRGAAGGGSGQAVAVAAPQARLMAVSPLRTEGRRGRTEAAARDVDLLLIAHRQLAPIEVCMKHIYHAIKNDHSRQPVEALSAQSRCHPAQRSGPTGQFRLVWCCDEVEGRSIIGVEASRALVPLFEKPPPPAVRQRCGAGGRWLDGFVAGMSVHSGDAGKV